MAHRLLCLTLSEWAWGPGFFVVHGFAKVRARSQEPE